MRLKIVRANPLEHEEGIKQLFVAQGRDEFVEYFDRAYPAGVRAGGVSWLGLDGSGRVAIHIARFPHKFSRAGETLTGGLMVNLMIAEEYRTFFPALELVRRVLKDSRVDGSVDFLFGDTNEDGSAIARAQRFSTLGALRRFVLPIAGSSLQSDVGIRLYNRVAAVVSGARRAVVSCTPAVEFDESAWQHPLGESSKMRPHRPPELFQRRIREYPGATDRWFTLHVGDAAEKPCAAALVRGPDVNGICNIFSLVHDPAVRVSTFVAALARAVRGTGGRRLQMWTLANSGLAAELKRAGFIPRGKEWPVLAMPITELGDAAVRSPHQWQVTQLDFDH